MFGLVRQEQSSTTSTTTADSQAATDVAAITAVVRAMATATSTEAAVRAALDSVRNSFGWAYGSYWQLDPSTQTLRFQQESGEVDAEFAAATAQASFREGVGINGRAWRSRDLVFVADLGELTDCVRAPAAQHAGVRSGVCFPVFAGTQVIGAMDFFATETLQPSASRLDVLRTVGTLVSQALERMAESEQQKASSQDIDTVNAVLRRVSEARTRDDALGQALDTIRRGFDWAYGSFWRFDANENVLRFVQESGDAGAQFREITLRASFAKGVGLSGRAWERRDLVFVSDLGELTDCVRAPAAQRVGVRSGVCFPILVNGEVVGTMDFFATRTLTLTAGRESALRNTAFLLGQALERFDSAARLTRAGQELVTSITEVERNVLAATTVAGEGQRLAVEADSQISNLSRASDEISKVVQVIQGIAAQTNLLALNATIEAARAGESGRGFGVVANEVKELANETARATTDVHERVESIQAQVKQVTAALRDIRTAVEEINHTQMIISGVLTEQVAVTKAILS